MIAIGVSLVVPILVFIERAVLDFWQIGPLSFSLLFKILVFLAPMIFIYYSPANIFGALLLGLMADRLLSFHGISNVTGLLMGVAMGGIVAVLGAALFLTFSPIAVEPVGPLWTMIVGLAIVELIAFGWLGYIFIRRSSIPDLPTRLSNPRDRIQLLSVLAWGMMLILVLLFGRWQASVVVEDVRTELPGYCIDEYETLIVYPSGLGPIGLAVPHPSVVWRVDCATGKSDQPIIRVNLLTCEINALYFTGVRSYKMKNCLLGFLSNWGYGATGGGRAEEGSLFSMVWNPSWMCQ